MYTRIPRALYKAFVLLLCISILFTTAQAVDSEAVFTSSQTDTTAFGSAASFTTAAWQNDALSEAACRSLLNAEELHPQPTGWKELDQRIADLLAPYAGQDTYTQLRAMYDWLVTNVTYSWNGYSKQTAPAYEYFTEIDCLSSMTYTSCMKKSIPDDMANRTMHILSAKEGVCYDYAIAFAVISRYIGIEAYVRTGYFSFEAYTGSGHHGWTVLVLNGTEYIFDPQRDARNWQYNGLNHYYFGITQANAYRYSPNYAAADRTANPARDASMLAMTADREIASAHVWNPVTQAATCTNAGTITSTCALCGKVQTSTIGALGHSWDNGKVTTPVTDVQDGIATYTCTRCGETSSITMPAGGSPFIDVQDSNKYYYQPVLWASSNSITAGTDSSHFNPDTACTRAQIVVLLYRMAGSPEISGESPFTDVSEGSWYYNAVLWGYQKGIVNGMKDGSFCPQQTCTRAQALTLLWRYMGSPAADAQTENKFTDVSADQYYYDAVLWGSANQIVYGMYDATFRPDLGCTRGHIITFLWRMNQNLQADAA